MEFRAFPIKRVRTPRACSLAGFLVARGPGWWLGASACVLSAGGVNQEKETFDEEFVETFFMK